MVRGRCDSVEPDTTALDYGGYWADAAAQAFITQFKPESFVQRAMEIACV